MLALEVEQSTDYKCVHVDIPYALSASARRIYAGAEDR